MRSSTTMFHKIRLLISAFHALFHPRSGSRRMRLTLARCWAKQNPGSAWNRKGKKPADDRQWNDGPWEEFSISQLVVCQVAPSMPYGYKMRKSGEASWEGKSVSAPCDLREGCLSSSSSTYLHYSFTGASYVSII